MMRTIVMSIIAFILIPIVVQADLTKQDLEEISVIVKESENRLNRRIVDVEKSLNLRMDDLKAELKDDISSLRWMMGIMFGILGAIVAAGIALPQFTGRSEFEQRCLGAEVKLLDF